VLHQTVVIVTIESMNVPYLDPAESLIIDELGYRDDGITLISARLGFLDRQYIPGILALAGRRRLERNIDVEHASYFLSRTALVRTDAPTMRRWRKGLFIAMWRNEADLVEHFGVPDERTVTMGSVIEL
jgi:KUP system potassium uptake protein